MHHAHTSCSMDDSYAGNILDSIFINTKYYCSDGKTNFKLKEKL